MHIICDVEEKCKINSSFASFGSAKNIDSKNLPMISVVQRKQALNNHVALDSLFVSVNKKDVKHMYLYNVHTDGRESMGSHTPLT